MPNVQDSTYNWKLIPESSWLALGTAVAAVVGSLLVAYTDIKPEAVVPITAAIAGLPRAIIGLFLPSPPTTGKQGDKST